MDIRIPGDFCKLQVVILLSVAIGSQDVAMEMIAIISFRIVSVIGSSRYNFVQFFNRSSFTYTSKILRSFTRSFSILMHKLIGHVDK